MRELLESPVQFPKSLFYRFGGGFGERPDVLDDVFQGGPDYLDILVQNPNPGS